MRAMRFTKMHGIGNDYVYVDRMSERVDDPEQVARQVSDRHFGIGADGLILICPSETADFRMVFDPTLVRGMSYYTGTIFEISMDEFGGSVGGGGRYDEMIGRFTGQNTPAVGFSIGFERIVMLLLERGFRMPTGKARKAYLLDKNLPKEKVLEVLERAKADRAAGMQVMMVNMKKNKKFQKEQLAQVGYEEFVEMYK